MELHDFLNELETRNFTMYDFEDNSIGPCTSAWNYFASIGYIIQDGDTKFTYPLAVKFNSTEDADETINQILDALKDATEEDVEKNLVIVENEDNAYMCDGITVDKPELVYDFIKNNKSLIQQAVADMKKDEAELSEMI